MGQLGAPEGHGPNAYKATPEQLAAHKAAVLGRGAEVADPKPGNPTNEILGALAAVGAKIEVVETAGGVADKANGVIVKVTMPGAEEEHDYDDPDKLISADDL